LAAIADRCARLDFEVIIASPLQRTKDTAEAIVQRTPKPLEYSELFVEQRRPSEQMGLGKDDPESRRLDELVFQTVHEPDWRYSDEETFSEMTQRAVAALSLLEKRSETNILIVTHGTFSRALLAEVILGPSFSKKEFLELWYGTYMANTGISAFRRESISGNERWRLLTWNDHAHLG